MATCCAVAGNLPDLILNGLRARAPGEFPSKPTANDGLPCVPTTLPFLSVSCASPFTSPEAKATCGTDFTWLTSDSGIDLRWDAPLLLSLSLNAVRPETTASALP